jgi:glycosyltransferase involved in cell wall biosynthesis
MLFGEDVRVVISTKPLRKECDINTLVRAIPLILKNIPNARFLIIGEGEEKEKLIHLTENEGVSKYVHFTGLIKNNELVQYMQCADVFVCTSLVDSGLAASVAEAMACGLPVIVSNSGDNKILIKDGKNGFIFPIKSPNILAEKAILLLNDEKLRKDFTKENRRFIEEENNYYKEMDKVEKIYNKFNDR